MKYIIFFLIILVLVLFLILVFCSKKENFQNPSYSCIQNTCLPIYQSAVDCSCSGGGDDFIIGSWQPNSHYNAVNTGGTIQYLGNVTAPTGKSRINNTFCPGFFAGCCPNMATGAFTKFAKENGKNVKQTFLIPVNSTGKNLLTKNDNVFITIGGVGVVTQQDNSSLVNFIQAVQQKVNKIGIIYDYEGWLDSYAVTKIDRSQLVQTYKQLLKTNNIENVIHIACPTGHATGEIDNSNNLKLDDFDYIAPMVYGGDTSYQNGGWDINGIKNVYNGLIKLNIDKKKLILTFQMKSFNVGGQQINDINTWLKANYKDYAGILAWSDGTILTEKTFFNTLNNVLQ